MAVYFITFRTYGRWLHGDERGSADPLHNELYSPLVARSALREERDRENMIHEPTRLDAPQRAKVVATDALLADERAFVAVSAGDAVAVAQFVL